MIFVEEVDLGFPSITILGDSTLNFEIHLVKPKGLI